MNSDVFLGSAGSKVLFRVSAKDHATGRDGIFNKKNRKLVKYLKQFHCVLFLLFPPVKKKKETLRSI